METSNQTTLEHKNTVQKYLKRPLEVEAIHVTGSKQNLKDIYDWAETHDYGVLYGDIEHPGSLADCDGVRDKGIYTGKEGVLVLRNPEGDLKLPVGHWLVRGSEGELYPCAPEIFQERYDPIQSEEDHDDLVTSESTEEANSSLGSVPSWLWYFTLLGGSAFTFSLILWHPEIFELCVGCSIE